MSNIPFPNLHDLTQNNRLNSKLEWMNLYMNSLYFIHSQPDLKLLFKDSKVKQICEGSKNELSESANISKT